MLSLSNEQALLLKVIKDKPYISSTDLQTIFSITRQTFYTRIQYLMTMGLIKDKVINKHGLKGYKVK